MIAMKDVLSTANNAKVDADDKKQPRIMDLKGILTKSLPGFKNYVNTVMFLCICSVPDGGCTKRDTETVEDSIGDDEKCDCHADRFYQRREVLL